jgi:hypothetical protein
LDKAQWVHVATPLREVKRALKKAKAEKQKKKRSFAN